MSRRINVVNPNGATHPWTTEDDNKLREFAISLQSWNKVKNVFPERTVSACQTRWYFLCKGSINPRRVLSSDPRFSEDPREHDPWKGAAIGGDHYVFRVPKDDPYLQRLVEFHGQDNINRNVTLPVKRSFANA